MNNSRKEIDGLSLKFGFELVSNNYEIWEIPSEFLPIDSNLLYKVKFKFFTSETQKDDLGRPTSYNKIYEMVKASDDLTEKYRTAIKYFREARNFLHDNMNNA